MELFLMKNYWCL